MEVNRRNAVAALRRILNANFMPGDWHSIFTYPMPLAPTKEQAKRDLDLFLRRLRKLYKEHGADLKYVAVTEYEHKRIHHHMVFPNLTGGMEPVKRLWKRLIAETYYSPEEQERGEPLHLRFPWSPLDDSGQYGELAEYLIKETDKSRKQSDAISRRRYRGSKNLIHPKPIIETIDAKQWRKEPPERKGYYIDKNAGRNGVSALTGLPVQETIYVELKREKHIHRRC